MNIKLIFALGQVMALCLFTFQLNSQKVNQDHKLLWKISSPDQKQDSYLYGTMHIRNPKVFNFSDSVYLKIEECKHFALEIHPDTLIKTLIVDPFNSSINKVFEEKSMEEEMSEEDLAALKEEVKSKTGLELNNFSKDNIDLIPLFIRKLFKKGKDKNTFLDAHLYHIAKILDKEIVGLESISDHRRSARAFTSSDTTRTNLPKLLQESKAAKKVFEDMIDVYSDGKIEELHAFGNFDRDSVLAYRNKVMVVNSLPYIKDDGIFMAVGAAHLLGPNGIIKLLKDKGFKVEPVKAVFSRKMPRAELASLELDWVKETYPTEGFSISLPDKAYDYRPESMGGLFTIRTYPDLGLGHFFFYAAFPVMVENFNLESMETELRNNLEAKGGELKNKDLKYGKYLDKPMLQIKYQVAGTNMKFRYIHHNNFIYVIGISGMSTVEIEKGIEKRFFESVEFIEILKSNEEVYTSINGAYTLGTNIKPQSYNQIEDTDAIKQIFEFSNFYDPETKLMHIVNYIYYEAGNILEDLPYLFEDYVDNFISSNDKLIFEKDSSKFGGTEFLIDYSDGTFLHALIFARGNRLYQILNTGEQSQANYDKASTFIKDFNLIQYAPHEKVMWETENFKAYFPEKVQVDSTYSYGMRPFSTNTITYAGVDKKSGLNFIIYENKISPYATYENVDSCYNNFKLMFLNEDDSILVDSRNDDLENLVFNFQTRNERNQLHYHHRLIFNTDKLYELILVQDTANLSEKAVEDFLNDFTLLNDSGKSNLLRDSSIVKNLLLNDLFDQDSSKNKEASEALSGYNLTGEEQTLILQKSNSFFLPHNPLSFQRNMLTYLTTLDFDNVSKIYERIYTDDKLKPILHKDVLSSLIQSKKSDQILLAKKMLSQKIPQGYEEYELSSLFYDFYDELEILKPLYPELLELGKSDSTILLTDLFYKSLEEKAIEYSDVKSLEDLIKEQCINLYAKLEKNNDNDWSDKYKLLTLSGILSFSKVDSQMLNIYEYFYQDSSYYYQIPAMKYLLRQNIELDLTDVFSKFEENSAIYELYNAQRLFSQYSFIPDSMMNMDNYVKTMTKMYFEEYSSINNLQQTEKYDEGAHAHYFFKGKISYEGDNPEEANEVLFHSVISKQSGEFVIPNESDHYSNYYFLEDKSYEDIKIELLDYYSKYEKE